MVRGPVPKRSDVRTRRGAPAGGLSVKKGSARGIDHWPEPDPDWHLAIRNLYLSIQSSGMADFYEQSDVQMVYLTCVAAQRYLRDGKVNANAFDSIFKAFASLGATEGERRRMQVELTAEDSNANEDSGDEAVIYSLQNNQGITGRAG